MMEYLSKKDILVLIYPNTTAPEALVIINPYDGEAKHFKVTSMEEVKQILREHLPWCNQGHPPLIHGGSANILEWETIPSSPLKIKIPEEIEKIEG